MIIMVFLGDMTCLLFTKQGSANGVVLRHWYIIIDNGAIEFNMWIDVLRKLTFTLMLNHIASSDFGRQVALNTGSYQLSFDEKSVLLRRYVLMDNRLHKLSVSSSQTLLLNQADNSLQRQSTVIQTLMPTPMGTII